MAKTKDVYRPRVLLVAIGWTSLAALLLLVVLGLISIGAAVKESIDHSRVIEQAFKKADRYVVDYHARTGGWPREDVLQMVTASIHMPDARPASEHISIVSPAMMTGNCAGRAARKLGEAPDGSYFLKADGDDCPAYYAPWSGKSTLGLTSRRWLDETIALIILISISALCNYGAARSLRAARRA